MEVEEKSKSKLHKEEDDNKQLEEEEESHVKVTKLKLERNIMDCLRSESTRHNNKNSYYYNYNNDDDNDSSSNKKFPSLPLHYDDLSTICHAVWMKFASKHQKSPSHKNNNHTSQSCTSITKKRLIISKPQNSLNNEHNNEINTDKNAQTTTLYDNNSFVTNTTTTVTTDCNDYCSWIDFIHSFLSFLIIVFQFIFYSTLFFIVMYCMIVLHKPTQSFISRNTQDLIFPFMRFFRILALPYVEKFPVITNLYEDSCLISNPYFTMDTDCWPCETSKNIVDLTGLEFYNFSQIYHGVPFIIKGALQSELNIEDIRTICSQYIDLTTKLYVHPNLNTILTIQELIQPESVMLKQQKLHIQWKISRVSTARLLRKYFPKPYFIPNRTEVSVQHFLFIDQSRSSSYSLPITEFANVFVMQASGSRYIVLIPTERCKHRCKVVSSILKPKDVLFYNWLYWRPVSVPVVSSEKASINSSINLSVLYVGSFY